MTDDMIRRQAAINTVFSMCCRWNTDDPNDLKNMLMTAFQDLPSAQPGWIPTTERLPDLWDERYLVSLAWGGVGVMEYKSTGFHNYGSFSPVPIETVTAWMPLPEPWKGDVR